MDRTKSIELLNKAVADVSWFSLKWRTSLPELHLSGRPSPGIERFSRSRCSRLCREGFNA